MLQRLFFVTFAICNMLHVAKVTKNARCNIMQRIIFTQIAIECMFQWRLNVLK